MTAWWDWAPLGLACAWLTWEGLSALRRSFRHASKVTGTQEPPARQEPSPPAAPGTRPLRTHPRHGLHLLTARYYASGAVVVWDGHGRKVAEVAEEIPSDGEWDEWLKGLTQ